MRTLVLLIPALWAVAAATAQNHVPELEPPPKPAHKDIPDLAADYARLDALYAKLPPQPWMTDPQGRHFIPNGVVVITEDSLGNLPDLQQADYDRMRDMGFNIQVIRLCLTRIGGWPGTILNEQFMGRLDHHIRLGRENGMQTLFKLTLYDLTKEVYADLKEEQWIALFTNRDGVRDAYRKAWRNIFTRYKDNPAVLGYDLLNEPLAGHGGKRQYPWVLAPDTFKDIPTFENKFFAPLYNGVVADLNRISPEKYALVQWWHYVPDDHRKIGLPSAPVGAKITGKMIFYAPHYYGTKPAEMMERYLTDAITMKAPLIIPEYGAPTSNETDTVIETQLEYQRTLIHSLDLYDRYVIGLVKAWWCGSGPLLENKTNHTWAMFDGRSHARGPERKYLLDLMCRPRPLTVDGVVHSFHYDFPTRRFHMDFTPGQSAAASEIYLPVQRHYPDGCRIRIDGIELTIHPGQRTVVTGNEPGKTGDMFHWDSHRQVLVVQRWPKAGARLAFQIAPGTAD